MDFSDFLIEYDLTEEQRVLAARLKAQAHLKQLLNALADHALYYGREASSRNRTRGTARGRGSGGAAAARDEVLAWFASLSVEQRVSVLTCDDACWVRTVLRMSHLRGPPDAAPDGRFLVVAPKPATGGAVGRGRGERTRGGASASTVSPAGGAKACKDPKVHYRRPHKLPTGEILIPPASPEFRRACNALLRGLRVAFKGRSCALLEFDWGAVAPSPVLVADPSSFVALMDTVSLGRFLGEAAVEHLHPGATSWAEAPWLPQWGSHFPLAAFLASRLEVMLLQAYAARGRAAASVGQAATAVGLPLAQVWDTIPASQRGARLRRLASRLFRRLLSETLATALADPGGTSAQAHGLAGLAALLDGGAAAGAIRGAGGIAEEEEEGEEDQAPLSQANGVLRGSPLELVGAATTAPLHLAAQAAGMGAGEVLLGAPRIWLHRELAEELAVVCSEHSASSLLLDAAAEDTESALARSGKRSSKKQRQKLRRRQAEEEAASRRAEEDLGRQRAQRHCEAVAVATGLVDDLVEAALNCRDSCSCSELQEACCTALPEERQLQPADPQGDSCGGEQAVGPEAPLGVPMAFTPPIAQEFYDLQALADDTAVPGNMLRQADMDWDGNCSEMSSLAGVRTSRSNSVCTERRPFQSHARFSLLERNYWDAELRHQRQRPARTRRWHDDSRLEFLLRNRDRFATELEWDRMSQGSVPASLDEGALYPVGLEDRFAYLFDTPPRSHVPTALASQATADDDAERLRVEWGDFKEWESLTQALEKTESEREMWKTKAQQLESTIASALTRMVRQGSPCTAEDCPPPTPEAGAAAPEDRKSPKQANQVNSNVLAAIRTLRHTTGGDFHFDVSHVDMAWRYLVFLVLARWQIEQQLEWQGGHPLLSAPSCKKPRALETDAGAGVMEVVDAEEVHGGQIRDGSVDAPEGTVLAPCKQLRRPCSKTPAAEAMGYTVAEVGCGETMPELPPVAVGRCATEARRSRAFHVTFDQRFKRSTCESATQTPPAITLSKMYGGMVPQYIQRELARLRQENQILRYRVATLVMRQPLERPRPVKDQATQTAPAITFSTARQQGMQRQGGGPTVPVNSIPRLPREISRFQQVGKELNTCTHPLVFKPPWLPAECMQRVLEASIHAFVSAVEAQKQSQDSYRCTIQGLCGRAAQMLWPRSTVELYGSFASGLALPSSGLDLVIYPHRNDQRLMVAEDDDQHLLTPIAEDVDHDRQSPLDEVSPGHPNAVPSLSSGWQQQLSCRLAQEKWVLSDSIRITAHAAIPVLSFITAPEEPASGSPEGEEPLSCPVRVDVSLDDPNHRGLRSKALINWLLNEYPHARPVTLVLKQWLIEGSYGMSHSGGLCSYGLLLMVVGYLQHYPASSAAAAIIGCLNFYGRHFDPQMYGVSVARGAFLHRKSPVNWPPPQAKYVERGFCPGTGDFASLSRKLSLTGEGAHRFDPLWVEDPLNPTNNVGRNCFRIRQIQRSLAHAADALTTNETTGSQLRAILRVESHSDGEPGSEGGEVARWRGSVHAEPAPLNEDLYQSLVEHAPNLMLPLPARAQIARSHLPQQWDSVVRYAARPPSSSRIRG